MSGRNFVFEVVTALFDFGRITSTAIASATKNVTATIQGNTGGEATEERSNQPIWGSAAILFRPAAPTSDGSCEVLYVRRGEEMIPIATHDIRWQVDLAEGDVVVRALGGTSKPKITLKADGTAILEADEVRIGDSGASSTIGLGNAIKAHFDALKTWADAHTHAFLDNTGSGSIPTLTNPPSTGIAVLDPSPTVPDVESRHKVEN